MIYVVKRGDTLSAISRRFGVGVETLVWMNQIPNPDVLVEGQALLVMNQIQSGPWTKLVNGYAYPFISPWVLRQTLPFLNQLSAFSYGFTPEGNLIPPLIGDRRMVNRAAEGGVSSALVLTSLDENGIFSNYLISRLLASVSAQVRLLDNVQAQMEALGYEELNIDFEYILPEDRDRFSAFVARAAEMLPQTVSVCLAPKVRRDQRGLLYEGKDFAALGQAADRVLLMTYEWGYKYGPPMAVAPIGSVRRVVEYAVSEIAPEKIALGLANYGYDWPTPFVRGQTVARTIGSIEAVELARRKRTNIIFDNPSQSPWFQYTENGIRHVVWFEDVRSWQGKIDLVQEFGLAGVGIWTVMNLNRPGLLLLRERFQNGQSIL